METTTLSATSNRVFNLYTCGHGNHDHDWDDFIDFSVAGGLQTSSIDYTYLVSTNRTHILPLSEMTDEEIAAATHLLLTLILADERIYTPGMWIGSSKGLNLSLPCTVKRSRKFNGQATLIDIVSKRDRYNREIYKALIVGDNLKYYVSPNCIIPDRDPIISIVNKLPFTELLSFANKLIWGHWNYHPYNRHLFDLVVYLHDYRQVAPLNTKFLQWAWKAQLETVKA